MFDDHRRAPGPFADLGLSDASLLLRRTQQFHGLAGHLHALGKASAAKHGIGPIEYDNIVATRISSVDPRRVEELCAKLLGR